MFIKKLCLVKMKKCVATKRARGSSSSSFDIERFVSAEAETRFYDSIKRRSSLKERGFELEPSYMAKYETVIENRGW